MPKGPKAAQNSPVHAVVKALPHYLPLAINPPAALKRPLKITHKCAAACASRILLRDCVATTTICVVLHRRVPILPAKLSLRLVVFGSAPHLSPLLTPTDHFSTFSPLYYWSHLTPTTWYYHYCCYYLSPTGLYWPLLRLSLDAYSPLLTPTTRLLVVYWSLSYYSLLSPTRQWSLLLPTGCCSLAAYYWSTSATLLQL